MGKSLQDLFKAVQKNLSSLSFLNPSSIGGRFSNESARIEIAPPTSQQEAGEYYKFEQYLLGKHYEYLVIAESERPTYQGLRIIHIAPQDRKPSEKRESLIRVLESLLSDINDYKQNKHETGYKAKNLQAG